MVYGFRRRLTRVQALRQAQPTGLYQPEAVCLCATRHGPMAKLVYVGETSWFVQYDVRGTPPGGAERGELRPRPRAAEVQRLANVHEPPRRLIQRPAKELSAEAGPQLACPTASGLRADSPVLSVFAFLLHLLPGFKAGRSTIRKAFFPLRRGTPLWTLWVFGVSLATGLWALAASMPSRIGWRTERQGGYWRSRLWEGRYVYHLLVLFYVLVATGKQWQNEDILAQPLAW
eukprot:comp23149_c0_seq1/m.37420 comp23149_c0_seq1/g.37420  ORF comp23149_c0_seq1/g.37420 comp23149_c0_seq1/m.37420 type:complete len:231 (-) comp23149_c0_seq1:199-891(-)